MTDQVLAIFGLICVAGLGLISLPAIIHAVKAFWDFCFREKERASADGKT